MALDICPTVQQCKSLQQIGRLHCFTQSLKNKDKQNMNIKDLRAKLSFKLYKMCHVLTNAIKRPLLAVECMVFAIFSIHIFGCDVLVTMLIICVHAQTLARGNIRSPECICFGITQLQKNLPNTWRSDIIKKFKNRFLFVRHNRDFNRTRM